MPEFLARRTRPEIQAIYIMKLLRILSVLLVFFIAESCSRQEEITQQEAAEQAPEETTVSISPAWPLLTMLIPGDNPIWFEFGLHGPMPIESPAQAYIAPFTPWPQARHISGMQIWEDHLVMAVNREGFLILGLENAAVFMYQAADRTLWDAYTAESFFIWENRPSVLLYRNDFFAYENPDYEIPPPLENQVYTLDFFSPVPLPVRLQALDNYPNEGPWETEQLHRGLDGEWYYRMREKDIEQGETAYFRSSDLIEPGIEIYESEWRNSFPPDNTAYPESIETQLPPLPEDFTYTGFAILGNILVASWEEQQLHTTGAAGFMVKRLGNIDN